jgi:hypothetical protein
MGPFYDCLGLHCRRLIVVPSEMLRVPGRQVVYRQRGGWSALMRIDIWGYVLATLLALLIVARYLQHQGDTQRVCVDDPTASVCLKESPA